MNNGREKLQDALGAFDRLAEEADTLRCERDDWRDMAERQAFREVRQKDLVRARGAAQDYGARALAAEAERDKLLVVRDAAERLMAALVDPGANEPERELQRALDAVGGGGA